MVEAILEVTMDITIIIITDIIREAEVGLVDWTVIAIRERLELVRVVAVFGIGEFAKSRLDDVRDTWDIRTSWIGLFLMAWLVGL
jgi:hypothetical protein